MSRPAWPVIIVCGCYAIYASVVLALWLTGEPTPPPIINSIVVAAAVAAVVLTNRRRCDCRDERYAQLAERVRAIEERLTQPQRAYMVPTSGDGLGPDAIDALRRMDRRLNGRE